MRIDRRGCAAISGSTGSGGREPRLLLVPCLDVTFRPWEVQMFVSCFVYVLGNESAHDAVTRQELLLVVRVVGC